MELDTGACDNFITEELWVMLGKPALTATSTNYESASKHPIKVIGQCQLSTKSMKGDGILLNFVVSQVPNLNLLGRGAIRMLGISLDQMLHEKTTSSLKLVNGQGVDSSL